MGIPGQPRHSTSTRQAGEEVKGFLWVLLFLWYFTVRVFLEAIKTPLKKRRLTVALEIIILTALLACGLFLLSMGVHEYFP